MASSGRSSCRITGCRTRRRVRPQRSRPRGGRADDRIRCGLWVSPRPQDADLTRRPRAGWRARRGGPEDQLPARRPARRPGLQAAARPDLRHGAGVRAGRARPHPPGAASDIDQVGLLVDRYADDVTIHLVHFGGGMSGHIKLIGSRFFDWMDAGKQIYTDTSWTIGFAPRWLASEIERRGIGHDRILFATDAPWGDFEGEYARLRAAAGDGDLADAFFAGQLRGPLRPQAVAWSARPAPQLGVHDMVNRQTARESLTRTRRSPPGGRCAHTPAARQMPAGRRHRRHPAQGPRPEVQSRSLLRMRASSARSAGVRRPKMRPASVPRAARISARTPAPCSVTSTRVARRSPGSARRRTRSRDFERVHDLGGRARRDLQAFGQLGQPHRPVPAQRAQGAQVGRGDVPRRQRLG